VSPVGLSPTSKVAPRGLTALMMGGWFITASLGGKKYQGILAGFWDTLIIKTIFFFNQHVIAALVAGLLLFSIGKKIK